MAQMRAEAQVDVRILQSIPTPVADALVSKGCRTDADLFSRPEALKEVLTQHHVPGPEKRAQHMLAAVRRENGRDAWLNASSAAALLQTAAKQPPPLALPCAGLNRLLGNALRGGGALLEVSGLPGSGKTQLCLQLCAAAQIPCTNEIAEAVFVDTEGSFVPQRYLQVVEALLADRRPHLDPAAAAAQLEAVMRGLHVCRAYDGAELYSTVKQLSSFIKGRRGRIRALVVDSIAFSFRHELMDNMAQRARVLADLAATLRQCGADHNLVVVVTNHMTTRFGKDESWLAPALGETWAHQPSTQLRLEKAETWHQPGLSRATLTKSVEKAAGSTCVFSISRAGLRDVTDAAMKPLAHGY
ncbi:unnamed protein product [Effrenium voratum]|nr:unnamed protein product [Effrenium voratum]